MESEIELLVLKENENEDLIEQPYAQCSGPDSTDAYIFQNIELLSRKKQEIDEILKPHLGLSIDTSSIIKSDNRLCRHHVLHCEDKCPYEMTVLAKKLKFYD